MDWSKQEQAMYDASRQNISPTLYHLAMSQGYKKYEGHRVHRDNYRAVPGNVGSLPPRERIERDPDFYRLTDGQVGGPGKKTIARGKGKAKTPTEMTSQRRYRKAARVKRPIELA